jgi:hypothetical protein
MKICSWVRPLTNYIAGSSLSIRSRYDKWIPSSDPTAGQKAGKLLINPDKKAPARVHKV